ncbi:hypothetical protein FALBO_2410 [Fusarium albosuccineum]|uniref:Uncharacterized protein n=1 Tax=Fusarium albosuccineum TaxID=1237068 RepID=A0A8H4LK65_9HYPO|nr:hypothetical protein FALBO_2410 [Fusarium albosuccineum]
MPDNQSRRRGRPRKIQTEEERLAAQRTDTQRYYHRLQQEDVGSVPYAKFYQHSPCAPTASSAEPQLPACCTPPDNSAPLPSNDSENPDDEPDPLLVGGSTWGQIDCDYDIDAFGLSDTDSTISQASAAWEEPDETPEGPLSYLSNEQARNYRQNQTEEGVEGLIAAAEQSLHISTRVLIAALADIGHDKTNGSDNDSESLERTHQNLGARYDKSSVLTLEHYLAEEWKTQPSCSSQIHGADHEELAKSECHHSCDSLDDVVARLDGLIDDDHGHDPLPHVTDPSSDLLNHTSQFRTFPKDDAFPSLGQQTDPHRHDYRAACQIAMEGTLGGGAPPSLCLPKRHSFGQPFTNDFIQKTYDIDSICSFPSSLAVAKLGIQWYPQPFVIFNHTDNVHFSIDIPDNSFTQANCSSQESFPRQRPLHHVPNYCFGRIQGLTDTFIWVFFPALCRQHIHENPLQRTCLPGDQYSFWYDKILLPSITAAVQDPNILQYIPKSRDIAQSNSRARQEGISTEHPADLNPDADVLGQGRRTNVLSYVLQYRHLGAIWEEVQSRAAVFPQFAGIRLYMGAKNLKLAYMNANLAQAIHDWRNQWDAAVNQTFLDPRATYIDIGRQYTPRIGSTAEANVFLWRRCCLKQLWRRRQGWSRLYNAMSPSQQQESPRDSGPSKSSSACLRLAEYPKLTLRDTADITIKPIDGSREVHEGLIYSQFYSLIKIPFDAAKQYPFQNRYLEKMALDPSYLADCERSTRGSRANQASLQLAYRLSKLRVRSSLIPNGGDGNSLPFNHGVRAEDRISLTLLERILLHFDSSQTAQTSRGQMLKHQEPPIFAINSRTMARFLHGTINKYCFLFEYIKSQTGGMYSLPETIVMTLALRSLRYSMSGIIAKESVLWKDRWNEIQRTSIPDVQRQNLEVEREGLGLCKASKDYGLGWWLPSKFDWDNWRFKGEVSDRLMAGNSILRGEYGRQWKVIRDIRDVHARMWQAQRWAQQYSVRQSQGNRRVWLEYLHSTVIELFQCDVWQAARKSLDWKSGSDLMDEAASRHPAAEPPPYCYDILQRSFHDRRRNTTHTRPYFLTGNKVRSPHVWDLVCDLLGFEVRDGHLEQRGRPQSMSYRIAVRRSIELISDALGHAEVCNWFMKLGRLLLLTNWILPWPSNTEFISTTKESRNKNLKRRLIWVSLVYVASEPRQLFRPSIPTYPIEDEEHCITMRNNLQEALNGITAEQFGSSGWTPDCDPSDPCFHWTPESLLRRAGDTITIDSFRFGRAVKPGGRGGFIYPLAERGQPPVLRLVNRIRGRTLEELGQVFGDLIVSAQSGLGLHEDTMNTEGPLQTSTPEANLDGVLVANAAQNLSLDPDRQLTSTNNSIEPATTATDTSSDSHIVDSSSDWSPPKRLQERDHPFFSIPSETMSRFLRASVNRYCFLFEHVKSQTGLKYSLPETVVMAAALRGLRFSYDSSLVTKESVLWGDRWTSVQRRVRTGTAEALTTEVEREGLGLSKTSKAHGFGWWLPGKFDWNTWRFVSDVGDRLAVGNDLLRQDYKRQWRVLRDIRDVHVRMWQAQSWAGRYQVQCDAAARGLWLEYLHSTVIELFQRDVWRTALKSVSWKTGSDVTDEALMRYPGSSPPSFCYDELSELFHDRQTDVSHTRPHLVAGNKVRSTSMKDLFDDLFSPRSTGTAMKRRRGWSSLPYRIATRRSIELVEMALGVTAATQWYAQLRRIVLLTHWILPWPSDTELLTTTKESRAANLKRRLTWASVIHVAATPAKSTGHPEPAVPIRKVDDESRHVSTQYDLSRLLSDVCRRQFGGRGWESSADNANACYHWSAGDLIRSTRGYIGIDELWLGRAVEAHSRGYIFPIVESGHPPQLRMVTRIRDKTLDELGRLFSELLEAGGISPESPDVSITPELGQPDILPRSPTWQVRQAVPRGPVARSKGRRYLQLLEKKAARTAEERERLRRHFGRRSRERVGGVIDTNSTYSDGTSLTAQTDETDGPWRPQKRLRKAVRDQMIARLR